MTAAPEQVQVIQADIARALKHLGFDSVEDLHYWAMDDSELNRFDALCLQLAEHRHTATADALPALEAAREALDAIIDRGPERDRKWFGMTAKDIALATLPAITEQIERMRNGQG